MAIGGGRGGGEGEVRLDGESEGVIGDEVERPIQRMLGEWMEPASETRVRRLPEKRSWPWLASHPARQSGTQYK